MIRLQIDGVLSVISSILAIGAMGAQAYWFFRDRRNKIDEEIIQRLERHGRLDRVRERLASDLKELLPKYGIKRVKPLFIESFLRRGLAPESAEASFDSIGKPFFPSMEE